MFNNQLETRLRRENDTNTPRAHFLTFSCNETTIYREKPSTLHRLHAATQFKHCQVPDNDASKRQCRHDSSLTAQRM